VLSLDRFVSHIARRGSWFGGGSVAALCAALAAALLEKIVVQAAPARTLRAIRRECLGLIQKDADAFARVIKSTQRKDRSAFRTSLKAAIDIPCRVFEQAERIQAACRAAQRTVKPQYQSDLRCALAVALAAAESARTLIHTNLSWLNDAGTTRQIERRLQTAQRDARTGR
jgi:formiminotetrahydrofolate cyclodeaminase